MIVSQLANGAAHLGVTGEDLVREQLADADRRLALLVGVNYLANRYDRSWDSSSNKQFSLSDQSIKLVRELRRDIRVTYFGDKSTFPEARDLLDRYSDLSPKLHADYIDPDRRPQLAKAAGYRSDSPVMVDSGGRREGAKALTEEEVTGALIRSLKPAERNVCVMSRLSANARSW